MAVRRMVDVNLNYDYMQQERNLIVNRRLLNLLSACRGYVDQAPRHLNAIKALKEGPPPLTSADFKRCTSEQYDEYLGYRVMEALRNHTQHAGFPLVATYDSAWEGEDDARKQRFTTKPYIDVAMLGKGFKSCILKELKTQGKRIPIMPMVRQYIGSLGHVHEVMRKHLHPSVAEWETLVLATIERFREVDPDGKTIGLVAAKVAEDGTFEQQEALLSQPIEYRKSLEKRNHGLKTLAYRYVSSEKP
jgi:hypothetical protein